MKSCPFGRYRQLNSVLYSNNHILKSSKIIFNGLVMKYVLVLAGNLEVGIVYNHWSETREFSTRAFELWNRLIRLSCYNNREQNTCPLYTHVSSMLQCIGPSNLFRSFRSIFVYNKPWLYCFFFKTQHRFPIRNI